MNQYLISGKIKRLLPLTTSSCMHTISTNSCVSGACPCYYVHVPGLTVCGDILPILKKSRLAVLVTTWAQVILIIFTASLNLVTFVSSMTAMTTTV